MSAIDAGDEPVLPPGFRWEKGSQHEVGPGTALVLEGEEVARLLEKITGGWFVLLERQRPAPPGQPFSPLVERDCSSFEQGRRGTAMWAARHEARIRAQVAAKISRRPRHLGAPPLKGPSEPGKFPATSMAHNGSREADREKRMPKLLISQLRSANC